MSEYGDFQEIEKTEKKISEEELNSQQVYSKVRLPKENQLIGIVLERLGGNRMSVKATDKKIRNCRVPGRFKRKFWIRPGQAVLIEPQIDNDDKGDIIYQYSSNEFLQLQKRGFLKNLNDDLNN